MSELTDSANPAAPELPLAEGASSAAGLYVACYYLGGTIAGVVPSLVWRFGGWTACACLVALVDVVSIVLARRGWRETAPEPG